ncbi:MAG: hypothetical protein M3N52_02340, partial [Actinomycetota bacterium]|nr:hypothetical protein [Actinomycetota bacterium]
PAFLVGAALVEDDEVRLVRRPQGGLAWLLIVLGSVSALALLLQLVVYLDYGYYLDYSYLDKAPAKASIAAIIMALLMPAWAAVAVPRQIGVSLLASWIVGAVGISISSYVMLLVNGWSALFTLTLLGLLVVAIYFSRAEDPYAGTRPNRSPLSGNPFAGLRHLANAGVGVASRTGIGRVGRPWRGRR